VAGPELIAAIDVGTNSFHMVVARAVPTGFEVVTREKETVRLGTGSGDMSRLADERMDRGVACLARMADVAASHGAEVRAVATSAVREARNRGEFVKRVRREAGIELEVVSGVEEARLIHLGVSHAIGGTGRMLLCDIGGGSTEIVVGGADEELLARSFKLGAVRLTERFFADDSLHPAAIAACRAYARSRLVAIERDVAALSFDVAVASSGTAETMARLVATALGQPEPRNLNRFTFSRNDVSTTVERLAAHRTAGERASALGIDRNRAEVIIAGAVILEAVAEVFGVQEFTFSDYALREGLLIDTLRRRGMTPATGDPAMHSVEQLARRCDDRPEHSRHVARLALRLFDQLRDDLGVDASARRLLEAAALLANVGVVVSHSRHHQHSYYVIRNSELVGLSDREIEVIAQVARYHRKSAPKADHPEFAALSPRDQHLVRALAGVLRISIGLDRTLDGRVTDVTVERGANALVLRYAAAGTRDVIDYAVKERRLLLADVLDRDISIATT
jgi:exopolyphosphatase/guanosine-5'-triphosphate,3'-diphosphate pyrophosphatase